jgi:YidC/Oxa1 family membrane protein insertase
VVFPLARLLMALNGVIASTHIPWSYGWAIIVFTMLVKVVTLPLTLKQLQSTRATQLLQPQLTELQAKYAKDRNKLAEEQMKLYKEAGVNPLGGCLPLLIQMPILFGLYQALYVLANPGVRQLQGQAFLWIPDLSRPSLTEGMGWISAALSGHNYGTLAAYFSLPLIMIVSQLLLQKMTQPAASGGGKQNSQTQMMGQMMMFMPIMFGYITLGLPSGLTLYWSVSNILSVVQQYFVTGWGGLGDWVSRLKPPGPRQPLQIVEAPADPVGPVDRPKRRQRRK